MAIFNYHLEHILSDTIDIERIGSCAIEAQTDDGVFFYLITQTTLGTTTLVTCGPVIPDTIFIPNNYQVKLERFQYKENIICKKIEKFLNQVYKYKPISKAREISIDDAKEEIRNVGDYLFEYDGEEIY